MAKETVQKLQVLSSSPFPHVAGTLTREACTTCHLNFSCATVGVEPSTCGVSRKGGKTPAPPAVKICDEPQRRYVPQRVLRGAMPTPATEAAWKRASVLTQVARQGYYASNANKELEKIARDVSIDAFTAILRMWAAENLLRDRRFDEAISLLDSTIQEFSTAIFVGHPMLPFLLSTKVAVFERSGDSAGAVSALNQILRLPFTETPRGELYLRLGGNFARLKKLDAAYTAYGNAMSAKLSPQDNIEARPGIAYLHARLGQRQDWKRPDWRTLGLELASALKRRSVEGLDSLVPRTSVRVAAVVGHGGFVDRKTFMNVIAKDLSTSRVETDLGGAVVDGQSCVLKTTGWNGSVLKGDVYFCLTEANEGQWEFAAVAPTRFSGKPGLSIVEMFDPNRQRLPNPDPEPAFTPPLTLPIKAPWKAFPTFRAGGVNPFWTWEAIFPIFALLGYADPCGVAEPGFFYGQDSHVGDYYFSIDFTSGYLGNTEYANGYDAVAVSEGVVRDFRGWVATGEGWAGNMSNFVDIAHLSSSSWAEAFLTDTKSEGVMPAYQYTSVYNHLKGPGPLAIPVSYFQFIPQGWTVGFMNKTGVAFVNHLHFQIHDNTLPASNGDIRGQTVKPEPMDTDLDGNAQNPADGRCMRSTNFPVAWPAE